MPFTAEEPASSIHALLEHLRADEPERYLYRGQVRHWPVLVPSIFRSALADPSETGPLLTLNAEAFHQKLDERGRVRFRVMNGLIKRFGKGMGNLIAQQYGISSEAIDVSSDLDVAAFFATRRYPTYDHFSGSDDNALGVIYRFPRLAMVRHLDGLDNLTDLIGTTVNGQRVHFLQYRKRSDLGRELTAQLEAAIADAGGPMRVRLTTMPVMVETELMAPFLVQALEAARWSAPRRYELTRLARQKGAFIRPPLHWICTIPRNTEIVHHEALNLLLFAPALALAEELVGIENTLHFPGMTPFFFRHTAQPVTRLTRRDLWPSLHEDDLYDRLFFDALLTGGDYFESNDIAVDDAAHGILDRGFSNGVEALGWRGRTLYNMGAYAEAIAAYDEVLAADADDDVAWTNRGAAHLDLDNIEQAEADFARAIALNPHSAAAWLGAGRVQMRLRRYAGALDQFDRALACDDRLVAAHVSRSDALEVLGWYEEALQALSIASKLDPSNRDAFTARRAVVHARAGNRAAAVRCVAILGARGGDTTRLRAYIARIAAGEAPDL